MYDIIIIGSGPAGYSAAIYSARAFLKTAVFTGPQAGGQLTTTTEVENYPGFPHGILGTTLMNDMKKQAERFHTKIITNEVTRVDFSGNIFKVFAKDKEYKGKSVIISTGASAKYLGLPSENRYRGKGVSACATCDGFFYQGKEVIVIGGGDTAMEEALFLTKFANKVAIVHRRDKFRASPIMLKRAKKHEKITIITNKTVEEVLGNDVVRGVRLKDTKTGKETEYATQGMFLAIGHTPNTNFLDKVVKRDEKGYILLKARSSKLKAQTETSVSGVFAAGDCVDPRYRQAIVAAGMGCMASIDAQHYLETIHE